MRLHRHWQSRTAVVAAFVTAAVLGFGSWATAWAAPLHPTQHASADTPKVAAALHIDHRLVLPQTSIDSPALSSVVGTFEGTSFNNSVIAWTGTDAAHHLNVETSKDGLHFSNQRILHETSPFRPDVTQIGEPAGGNITVAWTGSDANRSLNVLFDVYGTSPKKLTLSHERSRFAPAIVQRGETLFLAWTGTDAQQQLNILPITIGSSGLVPGQKAILGLLSNAGPHLTLNQGADVVLSWTDRAREISLAASSDGVQFPTASGIDDETSAFASSTTSLPAGSVPNGWIGWTGTDPVHHLNLLSTTNFPVFPPQTGNQFTLSDTAFGGPALAFNTLAQMAWTGTDRAHHLNIIQFSVQ